MRPPATASASLRSTTAATRWRRRPPIARRSSTRWDACSAATARVGQATAGATFTPAAGNELASVYDQIGTTIGHITGQRELVVACAVAAMVALVVALGGSMLWNPRLV